MFSRRSELAREKHPGDAVIQATRVIVDAHRERARSYRDWVEVANLPRRLIRVLSDWTPPYSGIDL